ncbi:MAG: glycosyltransferase [Rhodospirillales bacterium]
MRVLHVIAGAETGGAETFSQDVIAALAQRGVAQRVIGRPHALAAQRYQAARVAFVPFGFSHLDRWRGGAAWIASQATAFGADVVHAWMGRAASFVPRDTSVPVLGWFGGYYDLKYYRSSDVFVGVTQDIARYIVEQGAPAERVFVGHTFGTLPEAPPIRRALFDTPTDAKLVLVLSRLHAKKGIDTMLRALAQLPGVYLWLAGDGPERHRYEALCRALNLEERVRFLGWRTDRRALLEACDVCVLPSRYEPFGTVIAEAWFMCRPLVATRADGARQFVRDGENGLLCEIDDAAGLAARIGTLLGDKALSERVVAGGYRDYEALFSRDVVTSQLLDIYGRAVELGKR